MQILFNNEALPDHMTMKQLWLSRWFGKVGTAEAPGTGEFVPALGGGGLVGARGSRWIWDDGCCSLQQRLRPPPA